jgi:hypothetical protein
VALSVPDVRAFSRSIAYGAKLAQLGLGMLNARKSTFYGSTTFNTLAYQNSEIKDGVFFDPGKFSIARYIKE